VYKESQLHPYKNHLWSPTVFENKIKSDSSNDFYEMSYQVLLNNTLRDNTNTSLSFRFKI
jgi:hypothetical protein